MENNGASLKISEARTTLLSSGACLTGVLFAAALGVVGRFGELFGFGAAIAVTAGSGAVAVALIPLVYYLLNRFKPSLWGRYHLPLVIISLATALTCAVAFGTDSTHGTAFKIVAVSICLPLTEAGLAAIAYIFYSVDVRLLGEERCGFLRRTLMSGAGFLLGAGISSLPLFGLDFTSVGYGLGCLILAVSGVFYFSSVSVMPRFRRKLPVTVTLSTVRDGFLKKPGAKGLMLFLSALSAFSCIALVFGFLSAFCGGFELAPYVPLAAASAMAAAGTLAYALAYKKSFGFKTATACGAASCLTSAALIPVTLLAPLPGYALSIVIGGVFALVAALIGITLGSAAAAEKTLATKSAGGIRFCGRIALVILGLSIGLATASVTSLIGGTVGRILFLSLAAAFALGSGVFAAVAGTREGTEKKEIKP